MKLMSSVQYSDYLNESPYLNNRRWELHRKHVEFLKRPLTLGMFVPTKLVNGEWVVLQEPERRCGLVGYDEQHYDYDDDELREYTEAKETVLFEGFELIFNEYYVFHVKKEKTFIGVGFKKGLHKTVEDIVKYNVDLTQSAIKQIGL